MRLLVLCLFLISCGGGTVPEPPEPFKPVNLGGTWKLSITIPECDRKFESIYYVAINESSHDLLATMTSFGEYPDVDNMAACNLKMIPDIVDLDPYTTSSNAIQFKEFLSLRFNWVYDGIDITEYSDNRISLFRTVQTLVGERVWLYEFNHVKTPYSSMQRYDVTLLSSGLAVVNGCKETYTTTFNYFEALDDGSSLFSKFSPFLDYLQIYNENPLLAIGNPCGITNQVDQGFLPTYYPTVILALEFRNLMQAIWGEQTTVLSWYPNEIRLVRKQNGYIAGYLFK